jgi:hypothetical protein
MWWNGADMVQLGAAIFREVAEMPRTSEDFPVVGKQLRQKLCTI